MKVDGADAMASSAQIQRQSNTRPNFQLEEKQEAGVAPESMPVSSCDKWGGSSAGSRKLASRGDDPWPINEAS